MPVINTSCCLLGRSQGLWSFLRASRKELGIPCQWEGVCEPAGPASSLPCGALTLPRGYCCHGIAFGLFDVSASGTRGKVSREKDIQDFKLNLTLFVVTCETKNYLREGQKKGGKRDVL